MDQGSRRHGMRGSRAGHASMQSVSTGNGLQGARSEHGQSSRCESSSQQHARTPVSAGCASNGATAVPVVAERRAGRLAAAQRRWRLPVVGRGRGSRGWWPVAAGQRRRELSSHLPSTRVSESPHSGRKTRPMSMKYFPTSRENSLLRGPLTRSFQWCPLHALDPSRSHNQHAPLRAGSP